MKSKQSTVIDAILRKAKALHVRAFNPNDALEKKRKQNSSRYKVPQSVKVVLHPEKLTIAKTTVYKFGNGSTCLIYFHGGSYVDPPLIFHWRFLQQLSREANVTVYLPIYGRAPQHHCARTVLHMKDVYFELSRQWGNDNIVVMGDSAGGGLSLAVCEYLANNKIAQPRKIILLSPWLDVDMSNNYEQKETDDPILTVDELRLFGQAYRFNLPKGHYMASPLFGLSDKLAETHVFVGENEVFLPDCVELKNRADKMNVNLTLYRYPEMWHVFLLYPIPEAKEARKKVIELLDAR